MMGGCRTERAGHSGFGATFIMYNIRRVTYVQANYPGSVENKSKAIHDPESRREGTVKRFAVIGVRMEQREFCAARWLLWPECFCIVAHVCTFASSSPTMVPAEFGGKTY